MFFLISKLVWFVLAPSHLAVWLTLAAVVQLELENFKQAKRLILAALVWGVVIGFSPAGYLMVRGIENASPRSAAPAHVDGILVLGGGSESEVLRTRGVIGVDTSLARLVAAVELARRYPTAKVVFSGGSGSVGNTRNNESAVAEKVLTDLGVARSRLLLDGKSRNTWENFVFSKQIAKPKTGETWLLVTAAFHMPRAMAISRRVGWPMLAWPTSYFTTTGLDYHFENAPANCNMMDMAVHEYIGQLVYRITGRSA